MATSREKQMARLLYEVDAWDHCSREVIGVYETMESAQRQMQKLIIDNEDREEYEKCEYYIKEMALFY